MLLRRLDFLFCEVPLRVHLPFVFNTELLWFVGLPVLGLHVFRVSSPTLYSYFHFPDDVFWWVGVLKFDVAGYQSFAFLFGAFCVLRSPSSSWQPVQISGPQSHRQREANSITSQVPDESRALASTSVEAKSRIQLSCASFWLMECVRL